MRFGIVLVVGAVFAVLGHDDAKRFENNRTLWASAYRLQPTSIRARLNYAKALLANREDQEAWRVLGQVLY